MSTYNLFYYIRKFILLTDVKEIIIKRRLRKQKKLFYLKELIPYFENKNVFAFGTGGSLSNLKKIKNTKNKNILILTSGIYYLYKKYGIQANMWVIHSSDAIRMILKTMDDEFINSFDFSKLLIFVPDNSSKSKNIEFSSPTFKSLRKRIGNKATFVLYKENWHAFSTDEIPKTLYLKKSYEPLQELMGSSLEVIILPILCFLGVKEIYFSGIDHMNTGHFWDRRQNYQNINGEKLDFNKIRSKSVLRKSSRLALEIAKKRNISIYRLEKKIQS